ncbi:uncharacterized protein LOC142224690 [Haematobia irritans]|uniref:uncharacterized protein LOC142224690 n=1 Tax=Haematobia irritans TaxID=7368 RepID=UPI003F5013FB
MEIKLKELIKRVKKQTRNDKRSFINSMAAEAGAAASRGDLKTVFDKTRKLSGKKQYSDMPIKDRNGVILTDVDAQLMRWKEHFEGILNNTMEPDSGLDGNAIQHPPNIRSIENIATDTPTKNEIKLAINQLKNCKATGIENLPAEFYKCDPEYFAEILSPLINKI